MSAELVRVLQTASLALTAAVIAVWLLRVPLRKLFGAQAAYAAWLAVPLAVAASLLPPRVVILPAAAMMQRVESVSVAPAVASVATTFDAQPWFAFAWSLGALLAMAMLVLQQRRFVRALGRVSRLHDGSYRAEYGAGCPAVVGLLPPRLLLPADFESRYAPHERTLILAHERAHLARGDTYANAFAAALRCLFWFHPLLHLAIARFRRDQELACDAAVLRGHPQSRRVYADAMLKTQLAVLGLPVGCHWQSSHPLMERVAMLKHPLPNLARRALGAGVVAVLALGGAYAAWAAQPTQLVAAPADVAAPAKIRVDFVMRVDGGEPTQFSVISAEGEPFAFRHEGGEDTKSASSRSASGKSVWEGEFTVMRVENGQFKLAGTLKRDGIITWEPTAVVKEGEPAQIKVGTEGEGAFIGVDLTATMRVVSEEEVRPVRATSSQASAAGGIAPSANGDLAATEDVSYRVSLPPQYPADLLRRRVGGDVMLRVQVLADGTPGLVQREHVDVDDSAAVASRKSIAADSQEQKEIDAQTLEDASAQAVRTWRFNPARRGGTPVDDWILVPFAYAIN